MLIDPETIRFEALGVVCASLIIFGVELPLLGKILDFVLGATMLFLWMIFRLSCSVDCFFENNLLKCSL